MRTTVAVAVAVLILLAGCSGDVDGTDTGTTASETPTVATPTPTEATETATLDPFETPDRNDGDDTTRSGDGESPPDVSVFLSRLDGPAPFAGGKRVEVRLFEGGDGISASVRNDSGTELIRLNLRSGELTTVYATSEYTAVRNTTTGEVRYGNASDAIGADTRDRAVSVRTDALSYVDIVEWDTVERETVDGGEGYRYTADSLNRAAIDAGAGPPIAFDRTAVESVEGNIVVREDGRIRRANVRIEAPGGTFGFESSVRYGDITVPDPDWINESRIP